MSLGPEKVLLKWMNFHLKKVGYDKQVTNFSSDLKVKNCCSNDNRTSISIRVFLGNFIVTLFAIEPIFGLLVNAILLNKSWTQTKVVQYLSINFS